MWICKGKLYAKGIARGLYSVESNCGFLSGRLLYLATSFLGNILKKARLIVPKGRIANDKKNYARNDPRFPSLHTITPQKN